jgi:hypothetical protein
MPRPTRYEFVGGALDAEMLEVPMGLDGRPAAEVYLELRVRQSGPLGGRPGCPTISRARFTGPWVAYRLKVDPENALKSTYVLAEDDGEKAVMKANLSRFLHRRDEGA